MAKAKAQPESVSASDVVNIVAVGDTHFGCKLALFPDFPIHLDDGGEYHQSAFQKKIWSYWRIFWDEFVPEATRGEPYAVVHNGDLVEGVHHGSTTPISNNLEDQAEIAFQVMHPIVESPNCVAYYQVRGTETHVGKSGVEEERLAKRLGAIPNEQRQYARYELWKTCGPKLIHFLHHIGTTGSQAYEATAVHKELVEEYTEAARWSAKPPDLIVRSHRHRNIEIKMPIGTTADHAEGTGTAGALVLPCWQGKTPFAWKIPGARLSTPQFGGAVIRYAHDEFFVRSKVWTIARSRVE